MNIKEAHPKVSPRILFVEDEPVHYKLAVNILKHEHITFEPLLVERYVDFVSILQNWKPDLVVTDYMLPDGNGKDVLLFCKSYNADLPVIILTGAISEEVAVECMRMGASNYVLKNNLIRLPFSITDALQRKEAQIGETIALQNLKERELILKSITDSAGDGIIMIDNQGNISFWNPAAEQIFGYFKEEAIGKNLHTLIVPERFRDKHFKFFPEFQKTGKGDAVNKTLELYGLHKNGDEIVVSLTLSAVKIHDQWNAVGLIRDISEQKRIELELINAKETAEASDKLKTAFINNISHEVRTPLNGILGFSELIMQDENTSEEREQFRSMIQISSARLLNTITSYMDIALLMSGTMQLNIKPFLLNGLMKALYDLFKPVANVRNLGFSIIVPSETMDLEIISDKELHFKLLSHLLDNAVKFTHTGAVIFGYKVREMTVEFFVTDTGIGIEPEFQSKVFDNFRQFETTTTRDYEGSGLGLSITRGIVKLLGGSIQVDSRVGGGSTFRVTIPYHSMNQKNHENEPDKSDGQHLKRPVILLVEDDLANFSLQEKIIRKAGCNVIPASNGQEAVDQIDKNSSISAVIMDLKMPIMDGYEATRRIKKLRPDLPVIAVTAFAMTGDEQKALEAGCDQYLSKPIMEIDLVKILGKLQIQTSSKSNR